jgi:ABC-type transport system involved in multi-copper enzyme maturation permease subunit
MMLALVRKEWRLNRAVVIGCLVTMVMPYVFSVGNVWLNPERYTNVEARHYIQAVQFAAYACLVITVILAAAFGGLTFAGERRERTAEFLGMLPVSRGAIIASKLIVPMVCLAVLIGVHLLVLLACADWADRMTVRLNGVYEDFFAGAVFAVGYSVALFGIAWALSVFLRSPAIAAAIALGIGVGMFFGMLEWGERAQRFVRERYYPQGGSEGVAIAVISATVLAIGVAAIFGSSLYYRRRIEP